MFFSAKSLALAVAAIGFVTASPVKLEKRSGDTLIGYRNVSPVCGKTYLLRLKPKCLVANVPCTGSSCTLHSCWHFDRRWERGEHTAWSGHLHHLQSRGMARSSRELVRRYYHTSQFSDTYITYRNCAIWADSDALNRVTKAWIPEMWGSQKLWYASEDVLGVWIRYLNNSWDSAKTLRMSIISGKGYDDVQLLIPPGLLGGAGSMYFTVSCKDPDHQSELPTQDVNYDDWQNNIAGTRT